jgi:crossover junction endodeoxyribonuclease RuvC
MIILGIDPGSAITGFGLVEVEASRLHALDYGVIRTKAGEALVLRLKTIYDGVCAIIADHRPDAMAIESLFYADNARTALVMGHARGVAMLAAINRQIPVIEYSPREVKQSVVGNGAAAKEQVAYMVQKLLALPGLPKPQDASDALGIAICHYNRRQQTESR